MKIFPLYHLTPEESLDRSRNAEDDAPEPTDDELVQYVTTYLSEFRKTFETFFPEFAPHHRFYIADPQKVNIVRMGGGVLIYYQAGDPAVTIQNIEDLKPPIVDWNIFDINERFDSVWSEFDFTKRSYTAEDAARRGQAFALDHALQMFWLLVDAKTFDEACRKLLAAEVGPNASEPSTNGKELDWKSNIILDEPAGFRRQEGWGFEFKHYRENRITLDVIDQTGSLLDSKEHNLDVVCLVTSGDVTSIGRSLAVQNRRLRIWDRTVLNHLSHKHYEVLEGHFKNYRVAVEALEAYTQQSTTSRLDEFATRLQTIPTGQPDFAKYQDVCRDILVYLFEDQLKLIGEQSAVADGTQIRDLIFRNLRKSAFFERVFHKLGADLVIFDPKNSKDPIEKEKFLEIAQYPNKATGKLAILISRKGESDAARGTQIRLYSKDDKVVLSLSDANLLEMIQRKERGEDPSDLLDDLLDQLSMNF